MHILFLFVDGLGLGGDLESNPLAQVPLPAFERLSGGSRWLDSVPILESANHIFRGIDPRLALEGLPQSGTGQATLLTGVNCAQAAGRHYGPYPHSKTLPIIAANNIFRRIEVLLPSDPEPAAFANAYPDRFFDYVQKTNRWTVTTRCCLESGARIRSRADLMKGLAVPADLTGRKWPEEIRDGMMPADERAAAERLVRIASRHRFTLFEYFLTDKAGHSRDPERAAAVLRSLDRLLPVLLDAAERGDILLLLTSDHGNIEDLSTKAHTPNDVPFAALGPGAGKLGSVRRLEDVTPSIVELVKTHSSSDAPLL